MRFTLHIASALIGSAVILHARNELPVTPEDVPNWSIGEISEYGVRTVIDLEVEEPIRKNQSAHEGVSIYKHDALMASKVVAELESAFVAARDDFQKALSKRYGKIPLNESEFGEDTQFKVFYQSWINGRSGFVPHIKLVKTWAQLLPDDAHLAPLLEQVRSVMATRYIRDEVASIDIARNQPLNVRMIFMKNGNHEINAKTIRDDSIQFDRMNFTSLRKARDELSASLPNDDFIYKNFLLSLIRPNTYLHAETDLDLAAGGIGGKLIYKSGQLIISEGDLVTERRRSALDALKDSLTITPKAKIAALAETYAGINSKNFKKNPLDAFSGRWVYWALLVFMPLSIAILAVCNVLLAFRKAGSKSVSHELANIPASDDGMQQSAVIDALRHTAVQRLYAQRQQLIAQQQSSSNNIESLESRLAKLQPQIQERIIDYEARIEQLEKELSYVREENRGLISHQIEQVRMDRDAMLAKSGIKWS